MRCERERHAFVSSQKFLVVEVFELERFGEDDRVLRDAVGAVDEIVRGVNLKTGSPQDTADAIRDDVALLPEVDYLIAVTGVLESAEVGRGAKQTVDVALRGLERIARDTAPLLGWTPAT